MFYFYIFFLLMLLSSCMAYFYYRRYGSNVKMSIGNEFQLIRKNEEVEKKIQRYLKRAAVDRLTHSDLEEMEKILDEDGDMQQLLSFYNLLEGVYKNNYGALHIEVLRKKAELLHRKGDLKEALFVYTKLVNYTMDFETLCKIGEIYDLFGKEDLALQYLQRAYGLGKTPVAAKLLGKAYQKLGRYSEAIDCFYIAYNSDKTDKELIYDLGTCLMRSEIYGESLTFFSQIEGEEDFKKKVAFDKLVIYKNLKNHSSLKETVTSLLQMNLTKEEYLKVCYDMIQAYYHMAEYHEMQTFIEKLKKEEESYAQIYPDVLELEKFYIQWKKYVTEMDLYTNGSEPVFGEICKKMIANIGYSFESTKDVKRYSAELIAIDQHGVARRHILCVFFRKIETITYSFISDYVDSLNLDMVVRCAFLTSGVFDEECHKKVVARPILLIEGENFLELLKMTVSEMDENKTFLELSSQ